MDQHLERRIRGCVKLLLIAVKRLFCIVERCKLRRQGGACRGHRLFDSQPSEYDEVSRGIQKLAPCCSEKKTEPEQNQANGYFLPPKPVYMLYFHPELPRLAIFARTLQSNSGHGASARRVSMETPVIEIYGR